MRRFRDWSVLQLLDMDDFSVGQILCSGSRVDDSQAEVTGVLRVWKLDVLGGRSILEIGPVAAESEPIYVAGEVRIAVRGL